MRLANSTNIHLTSNSPLELGLDCLFLLSANSNFHEGTPLPGVLVLLLLSPGVVCGVMALVPGVALLFTGVLVLLLGVACLLTGLSVPLFPGVGSLVFTGVALALPDIAVFFSGDALLLTAVSVILLGELVVVLLLFHGLGLP